jgi:hypothetical protein
LYVFFCQFSEKCCTCMLLEAFCDNGSGFARSPKWRGGWSTNRPRVIYITTANWKTEMRKGS